MRTKAGEQPEKIEEQRAGRLHFSHKCQAAQHIQQADNPQEGIVSGHDVRL